MTERFTDMLDEDGIASLLEQHGRYLIGCGIEVVASRHSSGWYVLVPTSGRGIFSRVGRNGIKPHEQLRPFRTLADAVEAALSPANRETWRK